MKNNENVDVNFGSSAKNVKNGLRRRSFCGTILGGTLRIQPANLTGQTFYN